MAVVEGNPYWHSIVGEQWPEIDPSQWRELEAIARAGVAAVPVGEVVQARRAFENVTRASAGLHAIGDEIRFQSGNSEAVTDALGAAADMFRDIAELVYRTQHKILDIVDRATAGIQGAARPSDGDDRDGSGVAATRDRIAGLVAVARAEVEDVTTSAMNWIDPSGLPALAMIAELLSAQSPWDIEGHGAVAMGTPTGSGGDRRPGFAANSGVEQRILVGDVAEAPAGSARRRILRRIRTRS